MLTCDDVRELLLQGATGESLAGDVHDHVAACEACRAAARELRADLGRVRQDLAALAPSPFLEDRVLDIARTAEAAPSASGGPSTWLGAAIAVAAAALLAAVVILPRIEGPAGDGGQDPFGKDPGGPSLVAWPPTARAAWRQSAGTFRVPRPPEIHTLVGVPPPDVAVIGRKFLLRMEPEGTGTEVERVQRAAARLTEDGAQPYVTLTIASPGGGAARVRALVRVDFTGSVLLEEPLGRALGLPAHELQDRTARIDGDTSIEAYVVKARILLPAASLDVTLPVLVQGVGHPHPATPLDIGGLPPAPGVVIEGLRPSMYFVGEPQPTPPPEGVRTSVGGLSMISVAVKETAAPPRVPSWSVGVLRAAVLGLHYAEGAWPHCHVVLPALDVGGGGYLAWSIAMERVTLEARFTPGAQVAIARVWRGRTAVPSRETVAFTTVRADGRVSYVRARGEAGPVRLREVQPDGTVAWHEITVDVPPSLTLDVGETGTVFLRTRTFTPQLLPSSADRFERNPAALAALRDMLAQAAERAGRGADGLSRLELVIRAHPETPFDIVAWLMELGAHPQVRAPGLRLALRGDEARTIRYRLPVDPGVGAAPAERWGLVVRLGVHAGGVAWSGLGAPLTNVPLAREEDWDALRSAVDRVVARAKAEGRALQIDIDARRRDLRYGPVQRAIGILQQAGVSHIGIRG